MSVLSPSATSQITSSVAGLIVSNVLPDSDGRHLPSMKHSVCLIFGNFTVDSAVAILDSSLKQGGEVQ
jgi:hypothetical protein